MSEALDSYRAAFSLFIALERGDGTSADIRDTYDDPEPLLAGMAIVAARVREELVLHADHLDCDCGSLAWLERERLKLMSRGDRE